jgi:hypothetical protein
MPVIVHGQRLSRERCANGKSRRRRHHCFTTVHMILQGHHCMRGGVTPGLSITRGGVTPGLSITRGGVTPGLSITRGGVTPGLSITTRGGVTPGLSITTRGGVTPGLSIIRGGVTPGESVSANAELANAQHAAKAVRLNFISCSVVRLRCAEQQTAEKW